MKRFKHINAQTTEEAVSALEKYGENVRVMAGGTDLLGQMKDSILPDLPQVLVNLKTIPGLDYIKEDNSVLKIGALTRIEDIARNKLIKNRYPALGEAARRTASPHIREQGTIAGNICQSNRCWYYWVQDNRFDCLRKGGKRCFAYCGEGRYHSIFGSSRIQDTPCTTECPAGVNIPAYMEKLRNNDIDTAARILLDTNPFPAITGRVCPHTCESGCNRNEIDEAVAVRNVERFIGDYILENIDRFYSVSKTNKQNIAVIGSGPAGLSCAWYLRKNGYGVTVFETMNEAGGMLTYGIPAYRLPKIIVKEQVKALETSGIKIITGKKQAASAISRLVKEYDAVFIASGAWKERQLGIEGEDLILSGTEFLRNHKKLKDPNSKKVAVIGGGNVAMDVSRTLKRMGADTVILYRRSRNDMPAIAEDINRAEEEGIRMDFFTVPVSAGQANRKITLKCIRMKPGALDASGRPVPVPVEGSEFLAEYDAVIKANGELPDYSTVPAEFISSEGRLKVDDSGLVKGNLFAGGDFVSGPSTVIKSIAAGRKVAETIIRFLGGNPVKYDSGTGSKPATFDKDFFYGAGRNEAPERSVSERISDITGEDVRTLNSEQVVNEASRCLNCGCLAVNSSDMAPVLIALDAVIKTSRREIKAEDFFAVGLNSSTILEKEIVTEIILPLVKPETKSSFIKFALRKSIDFPVVNCAVSCELNGDTVQSARIYLNAVYNTPWRATQAEQYLKGKEITEDSAGLAGEMAVKDVCPLPDTTYKVQIAKTLVKRAILACK